MNIDLLYFLNNHCPDFLRKALDPDGYVLLNDEKILINDSPVCFSDMNNDVLSKIYKRLLSVQKKSGYNPLPSGELKEIYKIMLLDIEKEFENKNADREKTIRQSNVMLSIQSSDVITDDTAIVLIENFDDVSKDMLIVILGKFTPNNKLSYDNYKALSNLLNKTSYLSRLDYYSYLNAVYFQELTTKDQHVEHPFIPKEEKESFVHFDVSLK